MDAEAGIHPRMSSSFDCNAGCRSQQHAAQLISSITKGSDWQILAFLSRCHHPESVVDDLGRTSLHLASSCGRDAVVSWLIAERGASVATLDLESGWTALHRALFYGQLSSARLLITHGASLSQRDKEGMTPLDIVMKDRLPHVEFTHTGLDELFSWGANFNFTLGHENMQARKLPEQVEFFRKQAISIKMVGMSRYHSLFLTDAGQIYACGHGLGGRLGQGDELTYLVPKLVDVLKKEVCVEVAAATNHSVMLMEDGTVYSCGMNNYHQLAQFPPPEKSPAPKQVSGKLLKGRHIIGICAQRFHSVFYTTDTIFTCGLNAGQLGHYKVGSENLVSQPRPVSALCHKDTRIHLVTASDAATVVLTVKGDVYALHEYQCRKIVSKWLDIVQVRCTGGHLDHNMDSESLNEHGGSPLTVVLLSSTGKVFICHVSGDCVARRCIWSVGRPLFVTHLALGANVLALVTRDGEAFTSAIKKPNETNNATRMVTPVKEGQRFDTFSLTLTDLVQKDEVVSLSVERVPLVHRATVVATDQQGTNISVLQSHPNASVICIPCVRPSEMKAQLAVLLDNSHLDDPVHDVILQVDAERIPLHRYILSQRSEYFRVKFQGLWLENSPPADGPTVLKIDLHGRPMSVFRQLLQFLYTDSCDCLLPGSHIQVHDASSVAIVGSKRNGELVSNSQKSKKTKKKGKGTNSWQNKAPSEEDALINPIKMLKELAQEFGAFSLVRRLESVQYVDGYVVSVLDQSVPCGQLRFERKTDELSDVYIQSGDGVTIACHKCVLVARLEYFRSMFSSTWIEVTSSTMLSLPFPGDILQVIIDFIYTDHCPAVEASSDADLICHVLVAADQLLIGRLRDECEVALARLLTLRNVCELLEFASVYNATQLVLTCQQFISINLAALLETRALDLLSDEVMEKLTEYYKDTVPGMSRRLITPYSSWPDMATLELLERSSVEMPAAKTGSGAATPGSGKKTTSQRRRARTKSTGSTDAGKTPQKSSSVSAEDIRVTPEKGLKEVSITEEEEEEAIATPEATGTQPTLPKNCVPVSDVTSVTAKKPLTLSESSLPPTKPSNLSTSQSLLTGVPPARQCSLRDIISEEMAKTSQKMAKTSQDVAKTSQDVAKTSQDMAKSGLVGGVCDQHTPASSSRWPKKVSQKERKRQFQASDKVENTTGVIQTETSATPVNPWKAVEKVVRSFRDLMLTEKTEQEKVSSAMVLPSASTKSDKTNPQSTACASNDSSRVSWGVFPSSSSSSLQLTPVSPAVSEPASPMESPWHRSPKISESGKSDLAAACFTDIIQDEMAQTQTLKRTTNRSLNLIQMEEEAMSALLDYYKAPDNVHEFISVERVQSKNARPLWAATQKHSFHLF